jgi:hypothetical protein
LELPSKSTTVTDTRGKQKHGDPSEERADEHDPHAIPIADREVNGVLFLELVLRHDDEGKVCGEHDGRNDCRWDGQHEGDYPRRVVVHTTRGDYRQEREKRQAGRDRVQHEQDGENLEDDVRQFRLVRHDFDELWIDRVPELWTNAFAVVTKKRGLVQHTGLRQCESRRPGIGERQRGTGRKDGGRGGYRIGGEMRTSLHRIPTRQTAIRCQCSSLAATVKGVH